MTYIDFDQMKIVENKKLIPYYNPFRYVVQNNIDKFLGLSADTTEYLWVSHIDQATHFVSVSAACTAACCAYFRYQTEKSPIDPEIRSFLPITIKRLIIKDYVLENL